MLIVLKGEGHSIFKALEESITGNTLISRTFDDEKDLAWSMDILADDEFFEFGEDGQGVAYYTIVDTEKETTRVVTINLLIEIIEKSKSKVTKS